MTELGYSQLLIEKLQSPTSLKLLHNWLLILDSLLTSLGEGAETGEHSAFHPNITT